jgi:hypothetical protein
MYTVLSTFAQKGSGHIGDKLIENSLTSLIDLEKGKQEYTVFFRETGLQDHLETVNASRAILLPAMAIRDNPVHPMAYRLVEDLSRINVPIIPIGANYNVYPGDRETRKTVRFSRETEHFLRYIGKQVDRFSCREYYTARILKHHGIENTLMTGDPTWYDPLCFGKEFKRPTSIDNIVFSPPMSPFYVEQAKTIMEMIASLFPSAAKYCVMQIADRGSAEKQVGAQDFQAEKSAAFSPEVAEKNRKIREYAGTLGFEVRDLSHDIRRIEFLKDCDLHVGYECHVHLYLFRKRIPSVLITEDARGVGFSYTLGTGGFHGSVRAQRSLSNQKMKTVTSGYATSLEEYSMAPADVELHESIADFLEEELHSGFRRYIGMGSYLDDCYESVMKPFLRSLP